MNAVLLFILLSPYPYQTHTFIITLFIFLVIGLAVFGLYRLIIWKMGARERKRINNLIKIAGIILVVLFFTEITLSLITIHHVNKQLGFTYSTPDTPEGELFEIQKVIPGKTMELAGLKPFDRVQMWKVDDLYILLINNQGKEVEIPIKRDKKEMTIKVKVPELDVPLAEVSFLF